MPSMSSCIVDGVGISVCYVMDVIPTWPEPGGQRWRRRTSLENGNRNNFELFRVGQIVPRISFHFLIFDVYSYFSCFHPLRNKRGPPVANHCSSQSGLWRSSRCEFIECHLRFASESGWLILHFFLTTANGKDAGDCSFANVIYYYHKLLTVHSVHDHISPNLSC